MRVTDNLKFMKSIADALSDSFVCATVEELSELYCDKGLDNAVTRLYDVILISHKGKVVYLTFNGHIFIWTFKSCKAGNYYDLVGTIDVKLYSKSGLFMRIGNIVGKMIYY